MYPPQHVRGNPSGTHPLEPLATCHPQSLARQRVLHGIMPAAALTRPRGNSHITPLETATRRC
eukprot:1189667-Prorocentrum_minimum.AAC.1